MPARTPSFIAFVLLTLVVATCNLWGQAVVKDDTYVTNTSASTNYGASTMLAVQSGGTYSYIRFDLSQIPTVANGAATPLTSGMLSKATMKLFVTAVTAQGTFDVLEVGGTASSQNWSEGTITYTSQNAYTFARTLATGVQINYPTPNSKNQYVIIDITPAVKDWLDNLNNNGGQYNNGIILRPSSGSSISVSFSSKEDTTSSHDAGLHLVFEPSLSQITGMVGPSQLSSGTYGISISGNAASATALSNSSPSQCSVGQFASGITNTGNAAGCAAPSATSLSGTVPVSSGGTGATTGPLALANLGAASSAALNTETSRATAAEGTLSTNLNNEVAARAGADTTLSNSITAETTRATAAEATKADINAPVQIDNTVSAGGSCASANAVRLNPTQPAGQQVFICHDNGNGSKSWVSVNDETTLQAQVNSLQSTSATQSALTAETNARIAGDTGLTTSLNNEINRAQGAEGTLTTNLKSEVANRQAAVGAEQSRAQGAEQTLTTNLASEASRAVTAEAAVAASVVSESNRATAAETTLTSNVNSEVSRATAAEATKADINAPVKVDGNAVAAGVCTLANAVVLNPGQPKGQQVFVCHQNPDTSLSWVSVNDESDLQAQIAALTTNSATAANLTAEITRAEAAEATLTSNLNSEISRATGAEAANLATAKSYTDTSVGTEATRAQGAETSLNTAITSESARAVTAEAAVAASVVSESNRATAAENTLTQSVSAEATRATAAEATKADINAPVKLANSQPPAPGGGDPCTAGEMQFFVGPSGPELYACDATHDGYVLVNGISSGSISNSQLANNSLTVSAGSGLTGGGSVALGGSTALSIAAGGITPAMVSNGQYSMNITGSAASVTGNVAGSQITGSISGNAASITGSIAESQVTSLTSDLASKLTSNSPLNASNLTSGTVPATALSGNYSISVSSATTAGSATTAATAASVPASGVTGVLAVANGGTGSATQNFVDLASGQSVGGSKNFTGTVTLGNAIINQSSNSTDAVFGKRFTDSSPTGNFMHFENAAGNSDLWTVDATGKLIAGTVPSSQITGTISANSVPWSGVTGTPTTLTGYGISNAVDTTTSQIIGGTKTFTSTVSGSITGNAGTATALAGTPTQCAANNFAIGVAASGNANCAQPTFANLSGTLATAQLSGTYSGAVSFSNASSTFAGNAATATAATTAASASAVPFSGVTTGTNAVALIVGTGGSLTTSGTGTINATSLGSVAAANYARTDQANTFTGQNILGNTAAASGGIVIPANHSGSSRPSFPFDMEATNTGNNTHLFRIIAQDGGNPNWDFQFCLSEPCTPADTGLSIAGATGIITFAPNQTFPGTGSGSVTQVNTGAGLTGGPITTTGTISIPNAGVTNAMLANNSVTVSAGTGLTGGGNVALGGSVTLNNAGVVSNIAGTGISVSGATGNVTINNTGVTSIAGTANQIIASASTGGVTLSLPATINVNISGSANSAATATNSSQVGGELPATAATASTIAARDASGNLAATQFNGSGAGLTSLNASNLSTGTVPAAALGNNNARTICYVAGADNTNASALTTNDTQKSFFNNMVGNMTVTAAKCQVDAGSVTMNVQKNNLTSGVTSSAVCTSTPGTWQSLTVSGASLALGDSLDLSITAAGTARRLTVCLSATVN